MSRPRNLTALRPIFTLRQFLPGPELIYASKLIWTAPEQVFSAVLKPRVSSIKFSSASCSPGASVRASFPDIVSLALFYWERRLCRYEIPVTSNDVGLTAKRQEVIRCSRSC